MRKLSIDETLFLQAFEQDVDFNYIDVYQLTCLDLETGEVISVFEDDAEAEMTAGIEPKDNAALREQIEASPERYVEIPGRDHGEHHDILREFLSSPWTDDQELRKQAQDAYSGSIGGWREAVENLDVVHAYYAFRERKIKALAEEFLLEHGVEPVWCNSLV